MGGTKPMPDEIERILILKDRGFTNAKIARDLNRSQSFIGRVVKGYKPPTTTSTIEHKVTIVRALTL